MDKYERWYQELIETRKGRHIPEDVYSESHHIVPRCLGGSDDSINRIDLFPKEHFIAHLLLARIHSGRAGMQMAHALRRMLTGGRGQRYIPNSRTYQLVRTLAMEKCSGKNNPMWERTGELHPSFGKYDQIYTPEHRARVSAKSKGRVWSEEHRVKAKAAHIARWAEPGFKERMSKIHKGRPKTEEHRRKIGESQKGKKVSAETCAKLSAARRRYIDNQK